MIKGQNKPNNTKPMKEKEISIAVSKIVQDDDTFRCRAREDKETIVRYAEIFSAYMEAIENGETPAYPFPIVWVRKKGKQYIPITGFHRIAAARKAGLDKILANVFEGTENEALWLALTDNSKHGLRPKKGDLKLCIEKALKLFPEKSHGVIAEGLGCSRSHVSEIAKQVVGTDHVSTKKKRGRDGKEYSAKQKTAKKQPSNEQQDSHEDPGDKPTAAPLSGDSLKGASEPKETPTAAEKGDMAAVGTQDDDTAKKVQEQQPEQQSELTVAPPASNQDSDAMLASSPVDDTTPPTTTGEEPETHSGVEETEKPPKTPEERIKEFVASLQALDKELEPTRAHLLLRLAVSEWVDSKRVNKINDTIVVPFDNERKKQAAPASPVRNPPPTSFEAKSPFDGGFNNPLEFDPNDVIDCFIDDESLIQQ